MRTDYHIVYATRIHGKMYFTHSQPIIDLDLVILFLIQDSIFLPFLGWFRTKTLAQSILKQGLYCLKVSKQTKRQGAKLLL